jgi:hypothetical protein
MNFWLTEETAKKKASTSNTSVVNETSKKDVEAIHVKQEELQSSVPLGTASAETLIHPRQSENHQLHSISTKQ